MLESTVLNTDYDLAEMKDLCFPNLLINSDFKSGIINQRRALDMGVTFEESSYAVDRWRVNKLKVTTYNDYVRIDNEDTVSHSITQPLETPIKEKCTWYINVKNMSEGCYAWTYVDDSGKYNKVGDLSSGENVFVYGSEIQSTLDFSISIPSGGFIEIYQMKLEKGTVFTGMPIWDYVEQFLKCERYYKRLGTNWGGMYSARSDENWYDVYIPITTPMEKVPSLVCVDSQDESSAYVALLGNVITNTTGIQIPLNEFNSISFINGFVLLKAPISSRKQIGFGSAVFSANVALDAEIY